MKADELRKLLDGLTDDQEVAVELECRQSIDATRAELRDLPETGLTIFQIWNRHHDRPIGFPHLTEAEREKRKLEFLNGLEDIHRIEKWATKRYTHIYGDHRIYNHFGGGQDTCYGTAYDPRVVDGLVADGLAELFRTPSGFDTICRITEAGRAFLADAKLSVPQPG